MLKICRVCRAVSIKNTLELYLGQKLKGIINFSETNKDECRNIETKNFQKVTMDKKMIQYTGYSI